MSESAAELVAGQVFAGWRVERELARGGMGVLYLARHPRLPRTDVIKVLPPWLSADTRFRERFLREVTRMSSLQHPHVMPIHDSGEADDGTLYLVMPYISEGDLRGLLRRDGPLPPARAGRLIAQIAAALDAAHRVGVVHRDVKPENVLLSSVEPDDTDHALLTDFGISREDMATNSLTATGELLLTPAYAAPEQVLGKVVDARADQYALGCILFELLSGRPPFENDAQIAMLMAHLQDPIPRLAAELGLPPAIDGVLARAMAKSPQERYENCRGLAQAAAQALDVSVSTPRPAMDLKETNYVPPPISHPTPPAPPRGRNGTPSTPPPAYPPAPPPNYPPAVPNYPPAPPLPNQPEGRRESPTSSFAPGYGPPGQSGGPGAPPAAPAKGHRGIWIGVAAVVAAAAAAGIIIALSSGSKDKTSNAGPLPSGNPLVTASSTATPTASVVPASAAYTALLARIPANVRGNCKDTTAELAADEKQYVNTRASCIDVIDGRQLSIAYRTVPGDNAHIQVYRNNVLQIGAGFHLRGDCRTFVGDNGGPPGTKGFGQDIVAPPLVGALWCDTTGIETYLPTSATGDHIRILTQVMTSAGGAQTQAGQRVDDLIAVLPAE